MVITMEVALNSIKSHGGNNGPFSVLATFLGRPTGADTELLSHHTRMQTTLFNKESLHQTVTAKTESSYLTVLY